MNVRQMAAGAAMIAFAAGMAHAADQTIQGKSFTVKNPATPDRRKISAKAKELGSSNTIVGNPTITGASLTISANGGTPTSQTFPLAQGTSSTGKPFWSAVGTTGFRYRDAKGDQSAVKSVIIKLSPSGTFSIKAIVAGKLDGGTVIVPPDPGTDGCAVLSILSGDAYNVRFGPDSVIKNSLNKLFKAKNPLTEGVCGATTTTTTLATTTTTGATTTTTGATTTTTGATTTTTGATTTTTGATTTTTSSTTTTTMYGSPSRAFVDRVLGLLD